MIDDFNPLDLSAPPKKIEEPVAAPESVQPKATVQKVSMGPIFHSRITKILALILGVALAALVGYAGTSYWLNRSSNSVGTTTDTKSKASSTEATTKDSGTASDATDKTTTDQTSNTTAPTQNQDTGSAASSPEAAKPCGVAGMPEGVCKAITSIEKSGLKNNPYVAADTSNVPTGSTVQVDESSWSATSGSTGTVNFSAVLSGKNYKGVGSLQLLDGTWKVTNYTLQ